MGRFVCLFLFLIFIPVVCLAETVTITMDGGAVTAGKIIELSASGFSQFRYRIRPLSAVYLLEVFNPDKNIWEASNLPWSHMPFLREINKIKIINTSARSGLLYLQLLDTASNKVYETSPSVLNSEEEIDSYINYYLKSVETLNGFSGNGEEVLGNSGKSENREKYREESAVQNQKPKPASQDKQDSDNVSITDKSIRFASNEPVPNLSQTQVGVSNKIFFTAAVLIVFIAFVVYLLKEKNPLLDDKIQ